MKYNNNATNTAIYLLPSVLLHTLDYYGIREADLDKVSVMNYDINKPHLDKHLFIMIEVSLFKNLRIYAFQRERNFERYYFSRIADKDYIIFVFKIIDGLYFKDTNIYESVCLGNVQLLPFTYKKFICSYWDVSFKFDNVFNILFDPEMSDNRIEIQNDIVPEETYIETLADKISLGI
jgi:hypothetical protein